MQFYQSVLICVNYSVTSVKHCQSVLPVSITALQVSISTVLQVSISVTSVNQYQSMLPVSISVTNVKQ